MQTSKYFSDQIIRFFSVCVVLSFLCQILKFTAPINIIYVITLLLVIFCYIASGYVSKITVALTLLIAVAAFINGFRHNKSDYYTHILITLCVFMCIEVSSHVKISVRTFKSIANMFFLTTLVLLAAYYIGPLKSTYFETTDAVSLNFPNPNAAGLWLTCIFILVMYSGFQFKGTKRILYIGAALAILPIVLATQSRNSFLACILFVVGLIAARIFKIKKLPRWALVLIAVLPLVVFVFYMYIIVPYMDFWEEIFKISSIDKDIDTRKAMWQKVINNFWKVFAFGNYYRYYNSQLHNSLLTIFCRFGAPVTALTCVAIYRALKNLQDNTSFYATLSLTAIFFTGCFEASVFVGIAGMYLMLLLIPACASVENVDQEKAPTIEAQSQYRYRG